MTTTASDDARPFFVAGGTVPPGSPSYVERVADRELYEALLGGEFCYVLNSRQMGKSSLAVRTIARLQEAGVRTAFVDLTRFGGANATADQWYAGLLLETGRSLGLRTEAATWLREQAALGPATRYLAFLEEIVLERIGAPIVVMVDEIDAVRSLSFSTDDLFAGLRQLHNGRATHHALKRLTLCLLGAALPSDLIRDARVTPFNVGRRIELQDFSLDEARPFAGVVGDAALARVLHWTGGHPFLTQTLCAELSEGSADLPSAPIARTSRPDEAVDRLVRTRYLDERARETDTNLADVGNRLLGKGDPRVGERERADTLSLYERIVGTKPVEDDEANPTAARIKMSGAVRLENGRLKPRNEIYRQVFGAAWIRDNMPGQELRRQRKAFWKGALRAGAIGTAIAVTIAGLAVAAVVNERKARDAEARARRAESAATAQRDQARYDAYVASMRTLPLALEKNDLREIGRTLDALKDDPARGWEWDYWHRRATHAKFILPIEEYSTGEPALTRDGRFMVLPTVASDRIGVFDLRKGKLVRSIPVRSPGAGYTAVRLVDGERRALLYAEGWFVLIDFATGREIRRAKHVGLFLGQNTEIAGDRYLGFLKGDLVALDLQTLKVQTVKPMSGRSRDYLTFSSDRRYALWSEGMEHTVVADATSWREVRRFPAARTNGHPRWTPDGKRIVLGHWDGTLSFFDLTSGRERRSPRLVKGAVFDIRLSGDGRRIFVGSESREARLCRIEGDACAPLESYPETYYADFIPGSGGFFGIAWDLRIYEAEAPPVVPEYRHPDRNSWGAISAEGRAYVGTKKGIVVRDLTRDNVKPTFIPIELGAGRFDAEARGWFRPMSNLEYDIGTLPSPKPLRRVRTTKELDPGRMSFAVSPDRRYFALGNEVFDMTDGTHRELPVPATVYAAAFSPDGRFLVLGDNSGTVGLWRVGLWEGRPRWTFLDHAWATARTARFSPDGTQIALGREDEEARILDAATGKRLLSLVGHSRLVWEVDWSPDGRRIATAANDATVRLWDAATGRELCILGRYDATANCVRFLPGARTLASIDAAGTVKLWMTEERR